jgi:hypothetical protein
VVRISCSRCAPRTVEIQKADAVRLYGPQAVWKNKVMADAARQLCRALEYNFLPRRGAVTGFLVWEYMGSPWKLVERSLFTR